MFSFLRLHKLEDRKKTDMWRISAAATRAAIGVRRPAFMCCACRMISGAPIVEDPRQRRYLDALRTVIVATPSAGSKVDEIAVGLEKILGEDGDPTKFGFAKLSQALRHLQEEYYIINRDTLVRCEWPSVLRKVRSSLPVEGVLLSAFVRHIAHVSPGFEDDSIPGYTLEGWIQQKWGHLISVTPHKTNRSFSIFRRVEVERSKKVQQIERALWLLGRAPDLPVFTRVEDVTPLLPHRGNFQTWPTQILTKGDISDAFELDVDLLLRLPLPAHFDVFIDGSTVSPVEVRRALHQCKSESLNAALDAVVSPSTSSCTSLPSKTMKNSEEYDEDVPLRQTALRYRSNVPHAVEGDIVVDGFISISDELVAAVAARIAGMTFARSTTVVVVVGDGVADSYAETIGEALPVDVTRKMLLCTPTRRLELR